MREESILAGIALMGYLVEYLIFFDLESYAEQMFCFGCLRDLIALRELAENIVKIFRDTDIDAFLGGGHRDGVYQKCIYLVKTK